MSFNVDLFNLINHGLQNPFLDITIPFITHLGGFLTLLIAMILLIGYGKLTNRDNLKKIAIIALIALLFSDIIALALKNIIHEPRPFSIMNNVHLLVVENDPNSFPSGHATSVFSVVTVFVLNMRDLAKKHYKIIDCVLIIFAIVIGFSRIYVGVHFPFDVLAGAIIGILGALIINKFKDTILSIIKF